jgi:phosphatidylethanolamine-binding protein (PEBP) family uncharacterized protein
METMMGRRIACIVAVLALVGFPASASAMGLSFSWGPTKKCFDPKSPPISLSGVPKGTAKLRFKMVDLNAPTYPHGGQTIDFTGAAKLPYGAFRYRGPCPPSPHSYEISVDALDGHGKVLGKAKARRRFP